MGWWAGAGVVVGVAGPAITGTSSTTVVEVNNFHGWNHPRPATIVTTATAAPVSIHLRMRLPYRPSPVSAAYVPVS